MRHEHQMFIGLIPAALAVAGVWLARCRIAPYTVVLWAGSTALLVVLTLNINGFSVWYLFHWLPLASAIRAMTRFDQVMLLPVAGLAMVAVSELQRRSGRLKFIGVAVSLVALLIAEMSLIGFHNSSSKTVWRERVAALDAMLPEELPPDAVLFLAQRGTPYVGQGWLAHADEIDAMWVALERGVPTMNGYTGSWPPLVDSQFTVDCVELPRRLFSAAQLFPRLDREKVYLQIAQRVVPVGLRGCDPTYRQTVPEITVAAEIYGPDTARQVAVTISPIAADADSFEVTIFNAGPHSIAALSRIDRPIRLSWRYRDAADQPLSGWDERKSLPFDIPPDGRVQITLPFQRPDKAVLLEVSLVQEMVYWFHDLGMQPAQATLPSTR
jgi:hypothetical protein